MSVLNASLTAEAVFSNFSVLIKSMKASSDTSMNAESSASKRSRQSDNESSSQSKKPRSVDSTTTSQLQNAAKELQLSSLPKEAMVGRETERTLIWSMLRSSVESQRDDNGFIYISGLPGVGKTSIVKDVLRSLKSDNSSESEDYLPPFNCVEVNGMHMPKPDVTYNIIWQALHPEDSKKTRGAAKLATALHSLFATPSSTRPVLIVLLDELDFLVAGKNEVLYNLLEWQLLPHSKLVLVGIANTMDLPERMPSKIRSRMSGQRIIFPAYSKDQLQEIIEQRLQRLQVFSEDAIQLCAKTVSHQSGDVRQALTICRKAVDICLRRLREAKESTEQYVTENDLQRVQDEMTTSALLVRLKRASKFECVFLLALRAETRTSHRSEGEFENIVERFDIQCKTRNFKPRPRPSQLLWICDELERSGLVRRIRDKSARYPKIELQCSDEEIDEAFLTHPIGRQLLY